MNGERGFWSTTLNVGLGILAAGAVVIGGLWAYRKVGAK